MDNISLKLQEPAAGLDLEASLVSGAVPHLCSQLIRNQVDSSLVNLTADVVLSRR